MAYPHHTCQHDFAHRWIDTPTYRPTQSQPSPATYSTEGNGRNQGAPVEQHQPSMPAHQPPPCQHQPSQPQRATPGSESPPRFHAVRGAMTPRQPGRSACGSQEWHECVICLGSIAADGLNECANKMPDHTAATRPTQHAHLNHQDSSIHLEHSQSRNTRPTEAEAMPWTDGDISACTGSRSRSRSWPSSTTSNPASSMSQHNDMPRRYPQHPQHLPADTSADQKYSESKSYSTNESKSQSITEAARGEEQRRRPYDHTTPLAMERDAARRQRRRHNQPHSEQRPRGRTRRRTRTEASGPCHRLRITQEREGTDEEPDRCAATAATGSR